MQPQPQSFTPSEFTNCLKATFKDKFGNDKIPLIGDITETRHFDNYTILTITEKTPIANYNITALVYDNTKEKYSYAPKPGDRIKLYANPVLYHTQIQLKAYYIEKLGTSTITLANNLTKASLKPKKQKNIPKNFTRLAIITSENSKTYFDFINAFKDLSAKVFIYDTPTQGPNLPSIASSHIDLINSGKEGHYDCICIIRGGGSESDLQIYNDPTLIEAIQSSTIPVFTAIGHFENQFFCDAIADNPEYFSTPTALGVYLYNQNQKHHYQQQQQTPTKNQPLPIQTPPTSSLKNHLLSFAAWFTIAATLYFLYKFFFK